MTPLVSETANLFTLSLPIRTPRTSSSTACCCRPDSAHPVDVAREAVEFVEAVVLHGELQILRKVAVEFQRVAGGVG